MKLLAVRRLLRIQRVVIRYRLDDLLFALPLPWFLLALRYALPWRWFPRKTLDLTRGARLRLALQDLGPIFIKFGQILSTRRDLLPEDIADELMKLQDRVPPFDSQVSIKLIEEQLGKKISEVFSRFDRASGLGLGGAGACRAAENRRRSRGQSDPPGPETDHRPRPGVAVHPCPHGG